MRWLMLILAGIFLWGCMGKAPVAADPDLIGSWTAASTDHAPLGRNVVFFRSGDVSLDGDARVWKIIDDHAVRFSPEPQDHNQQGSSYIIQYAISGDELRVLESDQASVYLRVPRVAQLGR